MPRRRAISHGQAQRSAQPAAAWTLVLACIVHWQAWEISWVLSHEWDNVVLYGQYILTGSSSAGAVPQKGPPLSV